MILVVVPVPVIFPGLIVQVPVAGKPLNIISPVETEQEGCEETFAVGAIGVEGKLLITMFAVGVDVHPSAFVTVKL